MKADELRSFLKGFDVSNSKISKFFLGKKLYVKNENVFLCEREFEEDEVFNDSLIFIKLKRLLPSKYLFDFISKNSKNIVSVKSSKKALDFTYGKDLSLSHIRCSLRLDEKKFYLVVHNEDPIGYIKFVNKKLLNQMNIGDYLREN